MKLFSENNFNYLVSSIIHQSGTLTTKIGALAQARAAIFVFQTVKSVLIRLGKVEEKKLISILYSLKYFV